MVGLPQSAPKQSNAPFPKNLRTGEKIPPHPDDFAVSSSCLCKGFSDTLMGESEEREGVGGGA
jgi:hypothetical protein